MFQLRDGMSNPKRRLYEIEGLLLFPLCATRPRRCIDRGRIVRPLDRRSHGNPALTGSDEAGPGCQIVPPATQCKWSLLNYAATI
jgi:hypothetical protein